MEGAPLFPVEQQSPTRFEALDVDDTKDKKKKSRKKNDASAIHSRIDTEKSQALQEKRQNARKELGELTLSGIFGKQESERTAPLSEHESAVDNRSEFTENPNDIHEKSSDYQGQASQVVELPAEDHHEVHTEAVEQSNEIGAHEDSEQAESENSEFTEEYHTEHPEQPDAQDELSDEDNLAQPAQPATNSALSASPTPQSRHQSSQSQTPRPQGSSGSNTNPPTPPGPPSPPVSPISGSQPDPNTPGPQNFNTYNQPPTPPYAGNNPNTQPSVPSEANRNAQPLQAQDLEKRPVIIEKHNHFLAGLIVGGLYEHFKHRKREKQLKKDHEKTKQQVSELQNQQFAQKEQLKKAHTELQAVQLKNVQSVLSHEGVQKNEVSSTVSREQIPSSTPTRVGEVVTDTVKAAAELAAVPYVMAAEKRQQSETPRTTEFTSVKSSQEKQQTKPETPAPVIEIQDEPLEVPEGSHIEMSSWHRIEVDNKTGRAVEDPSNAYGHEFEVEHRQEMKAEDTAAGLQVGVQAIGLGASGHAHSGDQSSASDSGSARVNDSTTMAAGQKIEETQKISQDSSGPIIGLSIALVAAIGLLIFVLL